MTKTKGTKTEKTHSLDQIRKNYQKMDEEGRVKLSKISKKLMEIYKIKKVNQDAVS